MNKKVAVITVVVVVVALFAMAMMLAPGFMRTLMSHRPPEH